MKYLQQVDRYISMKSEWSRHLYMLRDILAGTELVETIKWGLPVYTLDGKNILGLGAFKSYVGILFFQGALLKDASGVLTNAQEGKTKAMRQWKFRSLEEISKTQVSMYIEESIANYKQGRVIKPSTQGKKPLNVPEEMKAFFKKRPELSTKFNTLNLTTKREFAKYIATAKRTETKNRRLEKVMLLIQENKRLYHKYQ